MKFSKRSVIIVSALLILLNTILRYPTTPHEIGADSFAMHVMANSISTFGYAGWWIHPASIIGSYPYSTSPSAVPFLLSGISQCSNMDTESAILLYSIILGIFSIFAAYLMAGAIWDSDIFKFLVAFVFSTCMGIVTYSTWTANARTLFIISLPLFIYLLLKTRTFRARFSILTSIILLLLLVTHNYIYFTIPVILSYFVVVLLYKFRNYIESVKIPENFANIAMLASFLIMFSIPLFTRTFMEIDPAVQRSGGEQYVLVFIQNYARYIGILIIFSVSGFIYLLLKRNKKVEEWFLLLCLTGLAPFFSILTYMKWLILPFASLLIGMGLTNIAKPSQKKKYASFFVVILLLFSVSFTGYYQYLHFLNDPNPYTRHMEERTYIGALWIKDNINIDKNMIIECYLTHKVFSISEVPTLTGIGAADLAYGFVDPKKLEVKQVHSPFSLNFYFSNPYKTVNHTLTSTIVRKISNSDINAMSKNWGIRSIPRFNLSYYVENTDLDNTFTRSVQQTKDNVYDNGQIRVWCLAADVKNHVISQD